MSGWDREGKSLNRKGNDHGWDREGLGRRRGMEEAEEGKNGHKGNGIE